MNKPDAPFYPGVNHTTKNSDKIWFKASAMMGVDKLKDVRAHCYCASLVRTQFIRHVRATSSISSARVESKLNKI